MALQRSGTFLKAGGVSAAIFKQVKLINLKPVKRISIKFDPFNDHVRNVRDFTSLIYLKKVAKTNLSCIVKVEVSSNRSESEVLFDLINGTKLLFKCANLTTLEILQLINKHITPLAPPPETTQGVETKSEKKGKKK